jgi:hypothetical protein
MLGPGITGALPVTGTLAYVDLFSKRAFLLAPAILMAAGLTACKGSDGSAAGASPTTSSSPASTASQASVAATAASAQAAAGGSGGGEAAAKLPKPCSLIPADEASSTLGYPVSAIDSSAGNDPDQISCIYMHGSSPVMVVLIRAWTLDHFTADAAKEPGPPSKISGVGTSAYAGANDHGPVVMTWERGVSVAVSGVSPVTADQARSLAKVAVGQLDQG